MYQQTAAAAVEHAAAAAAAAAPTPRQVRVRVQSASPEPSQPASARGAGSGAASGRATREETKAAEGSHGGAEKGAEESEGDDLLTVTVRIIGAKNVLGADKVLLLISKADLYFGILPSNYSFPSRLPPIIRPLSSHATIDIQCLPPFFSLFIYACFRDSDPFCQIWLEIEHLSYPSLPLPVGVAALPASFICL